VLLENANDAAEHERKVVLAVELGDEKPERVVVLLGGRPAGCAGCGGNVVERAVVERDEQRHETHANHGLALLGGAEHQVVVRHTAGLGGQRRVEQRAQEREHQAPLERVGQMLERRVGRGRERRRGGVHRLREEDDEEAQHLGLVPVEFGRASNADRRAHALLPDDVLVSALSRV
jgi:hypothetical protein